MEDDAGWIVDSVVQYLVSPIWRTPVFGFMDSKCIVFDPDGSKENEKVYRELFDEYKTIVQFLLDSFLEDIGINGEQFVEACKQQGNDRPEAVMAAFEQVEAARSYELFKSAMMKRNVDLELQALRMIQERNGVIPNIMQPGEDTTIQYSQAMVDDEEERILQEVLKKSQEEFEAQKGSNSKDIDHELEKALANSKEESDRLSARKKEEQDILDKVLTESKEEARRRKQLEREEQMRQKTLNLSISNEGGKKSSSGLPPVKGSSKPSSSGSKASTSSSKPASSKPPPSTAKSPTPSSVSNAEAAANWLSSAKAEASSDISRTSRTSALSGADPAELKKREEYLKKQREKILAMKQQERQKSLQAYTANDAGAKARPKSARAAKQVTSGEVKVPNKSDAEQQKQLAMRKALAERLKQEVVNKK